MIGLLANKIGNISANIEGYSAASFIGLDYFLNSNSFSRLPIIEMRTIQGILSILSKIGFNIPSSDPFLPHFYYDGKTSNIYTSLMEPIWDYGIVGMLITRVILGIIYAKFYAIIKNQIQDNCINVSIVLISTYYNLVIAAIDDQFMSLIGVYFIYQLIGNYILVRVMLKQKSNYL